MVSQEKRCSTALDEVIKQYDTNSEPLFGTVADALIFKAMFLDTMERTISERELSSALLKCLGGS